MFSVLNHKKKLLAGEQIATENPQVALSWWFVGRIWI